MVRHVARRGWFAGLLVALAVVAAAGRASADEIRSAERIVDRDLDIWFGTLAYPLSTRASQRRAIT